MLPPLETFLGAAMIFGLRVCDVSIGTLRTIFIIQRKKAPAAFLGFLESTIWVLAIREIFAHMDNWWNILGYGLGFATGNYIGILLEQTAFVGYLQIHVFSKHYADSIADALRKTKFGVTLLAGEGGSGGMAVITSIILRNRMKEFQGIIDSIDDTAMIASQPVSRHRGYIHGART